MALKVSSGVNVIGPEPAMGSPAGQQRDRIGLTALFLGIASLIIFLWHVRTPPYPYYDEAQYINAAEALLAHAGNTNPEAPPLGKLFLEAGIQVFGDNATGWRTIGCGFGALTLVGVFLWVWLLLQDYALALMAALLTFFNNFLYVMARVAMMDIFLVTFLISGLVAFTAAIEINSLGRMKRTLLLAASGVLFGLACACKWNGLDTLGVVILIGGGLYWWARRFPNQETSRLAQNLRQVGIIPTCLCLVVLPVLAYGLTFWPLCRSLHQPFNLRELVAMNVFIWRFHKAVPGNPAIAEPWYSWIFQVAPQRALSYLVGNWAIMWGGLVALTVCVVRMRNRLPEIFVVALYVGNLLQWAVTPQRLLYYYYYFPAAIFLGIAIPVALHRMPSRLFGVRLSVICVVPAGCVFLYCFPHMAHLDAPFDCMLGCWP